MTFDTGNIMDFRSALSELRQATPGLPMREAAAELGISEAELLAAHCLESGGEGVRRLDGDWLPLLARLGALGAMVILTRNEHAILQQKAPYSRLAVRGSTATSAGPGRELVLQLLSFRNEAVAELRGLTHEWNDQLYALPVQAP